MTGHYHDELYPNSVKPIKRKVTKRDVKKIAKALIRAAGMERKDIQKEEKLWNYLTKKLKELGDNNYTAKLIYRYVQKNFVDKK